MSEQHGGENRAHTGSEDEHAPFFRRTSFIVECLLAAIYVQNCFSGHWHGWWPEMVIVSFVIIGARIIHQNLRRRKHRSPFLWSLLTGLLALTIVFLLLWFFPDPPEQIAKVVSSVDDLRSEVSGIKSDVEMIKRPPIQSSLSPGQKSFLIDPLRKYAGQKCKIFSPSGNENAQLLGLDIAKALNAIGWDCITYSKSELDPDLTVMVIISSDYSDSRKKHEAASALVSQFKALGMLQHDEIIPTSGGVSGDEIRISVGTKAFPEFAPFQVSQSINSSSLFPSTNPQPLSPATWPAFPQ